MDGSMWACEGGDAAEQRAMHTFARAQPEQHPAPDALAWLRPTMGVCVSAPRGIVGRDVLCGFLELCGELSLIHI